PFVVVVEANLDELLVRDFCVPVRNQVEARLRSVDRRIDLIDEASVSAAAEPLHEEKLEIGIERDRQAHLFADLAKEPECVPVVLFEVAELRPPSAARERDVRSDAADVEIRVEREV